MSIQLKSRILRITVTARRKDEAWVLSLVQALLTLLILSGACTRRLGKRFRRIHQA